ncbi:class I SAM-dependent methyltransferase [Halopiger xanaduensis]|uniref:Methyltransferase type 11 n=1 Tax=Halopiger xanaduensis (strain DSM 18323 / JCM 14033 / SH-6) TaxID=797210 RepID=F8DB54_HALXS|nr:class I SAM-dependent methyltransferase [Halopiger xanaduensis]AEH38467.1 Methyltransferase type 11 [Halopiger xanaduensis SH-6]
MDVPKTVATALEDRPVEGAVCLEAGAGAGNTTAGLLTRGAARVYAVTNDREHARTTVNRVLEDEDGDDDNSADDRTDRLAVLEADLRKIPLPGDSVDLVTAHGLFNVLPPADLETVAAELTRVAAPGCHLVIDDYEPLPDDAAVRKLFALENAAAELTDGRPALTFYPAAVLRRLFAGYGWEFDRRRTLLEPVPWTEQHLSAHAAVVRERVDRLPDSSGVGETFLERADRLAESIGSESVGEMYSIAMRLPA